jgi:metallo-beta-lactamase family protein
MEIEFHGAAGTVTGSKHLVTLGGRRILLDCGLFQGFKVLRERNWAPPAFDVRSIDAVVLSHAHLDHSGWLPGLVRMATAGRSTLRRPRCDLAEVLLLDSAHLQEEDARRANRYGYLAARQGAAAVHQGRCPACDRQAHAAAPAGARWRWARWASC